MDWVPGAATTCEEESRFLFESPYICQMLGNSVPQKGHYYYFPMYLPIIMYLLNKYVSPFFMNFKDFHDQQPELLNSMREGGHIMSLMHHTVGTDSCASLPSRVNTVSVRFLKRH